MLPASRTLRVLVPLLAVVAAVALLAGPSLGQSGLKGKSGELSDARCYGHHREEGFRSMDLFPVTVTQVKQGETFRFDLTIQNPWLHDMLDVYGIVNISGIPGARFPGEKEPVTVKASDSLQLSPGSPLGGLGVPVAPAPASKSHGFDVEANATEIVAVLVGAAGPGERNVWELAITPPSGSPVYRTVARPFEADLEGGPANVATIRLTYANITDGGLGPWTATATYVRGTDATAQYNLDVTTYYNLSRSTELLVKGPDVLKKRGKATLSFDIIAPAETVADAKLLYGGKTIAHHEHTDPNAEDYGNYTKWSTLTFSVSEGETLIGQGVVIAAAADPGPIMRAYGQILGFTSSFLLLPALFLGGTFGTGSVRLFNTVLGTARRRVLWHNSTSYLLLAASLLHMFLFLFENFWDWSYGLFWGGLSLAAMIGLAFTGAFQKRFVAKWGFERWRFTHFSLGTIVIGFVLVHMLADGSHLAVIREMLGANPSG